MSDLSFFQTLARGLFGLPCELPEDELCVNEAVNDKTHTIADLEAKLRSAEEEIERLRESLTIISKYPNHSNSGTMAISRAKITLQGKY